MTKKPQLPSDGEKYREQLITRICTESANTASDFELVELILLFQDLQRDTRSLAALLIKRFGSFTSVLSASPSDLQKVAGVNLRDIAAFQTFNVAARHLSRITE